MHAVRVCSLIMDCVGCEKCRLHGKVGILAVRSLRYCAHMVPASQLQILGVGTALRILFSDAAIKPEDMQRNEVMVRTASQSFC
jgi:hypothetical protein